MTGIKKVNCPHCQKIVPWLETELFRPFCSKQCQLIDFGDWISEKHSIPAEPASIETDTGEDDD